MRQYNLDIHGEGISDPVTYNAIKEAIHTKENKNWQILLIISDLISNIKGNDLLKPVLKLVEEAGILCNKEGFEEKLLLACSGKFYPDDDLIRIKAIAFADLIAREVYHKLTSGGTAELLVNIHERKVFTNINEIEKQFKRRSYLGFAERNENLDPAQRKEDYSALLRSMAGLNYEYGTEFFKDEVTYFATLKENIPTKTAKGYRSIQQSTIPKGRPKAFIKPIDQYFVGYDVATNKKYLLALKEKFQDRPPLNFIFMIKALEEMGDIKFKSRKEIYVALETYFEKIYATDSAKNVHYNKPDPQLLSSTIKLIQSIKEDNFIFKVV